MLLIPSIFDVTFPVFGVMFSAVARNFRFLSKIKIRNYSCLMIFTRIWNSKFAIFPISIFIFLKSWTSNSPFFVNSIDSNIKIELKIIWIIKSKFLLTLRLIRFSPRSTARNIVSILDSVFTFFAIGSRVSPLSSPK